MIALSGELTVQVFCSVVRSGTDLPSVAIRLNLSLLKKTGCDLLVNHYISEAGFEK